MQDSKLRIHLASSGGGRSTRSSGGSSSSGGGVAAQHQQRGRRGGAPARPSLAAVAALALMCAAAVVVCSPHGVQQRQQRYTTRLTVRIGGRRRGQAGVSTAAAAAGEPPPVFGADVNEFFPQAAKQCATWARDHAAMHAGALAGGSGSGSTVGEQRHLVSVAADKGVADRMLGTVTLLYVAALGGRAFSELTSGGLPSLGAACDAGSALFDWASPARVAALVPPEAAAALKTLPGEADNCCDKRPLPASVDRERFAALFWVDAPLQANVKGYANPQRFAYARQLDVLKFGNVSGLPSGNPRAPFLLAASNRGRTHALAGNPFHAAQFAAWGLNKENAFMCGWFALCPSLSPALVEYYSPLWRRLRAEQRAGALVIGIQVRCGDHVFGVEEEASANSGGGGGGGGGAPHDADDPHSVAPAEHVADVLRRAAPFFRCALAVQRARARPGQRVVFFLNADSLALRKAAKRRFGDKLITDTELMPGHSKAREPALMHAVGSMLTFALADLHVVTRNSGFGRAGAWLSGHQRDRLWEVGPDGGDDAGACESPVPLSKSSETWSGV